MTTLVMLHHHKHATVNGKPGAWFRGYRYGEERSCLKKFFTYESIIKSFEAYPTLAGQEFGRWGVKDSEGDLHVYDCKVLTKEFNAALAKGFEVACRTSHHDAVRGREPVLHLQDILTGLEDEPELALFTAQEKKRAMNPGKIRKALEDTHGKSLDPTQVEFYAAMKLDGMIVPGRELVRAASFLSPEPSGPILQAHL